MSHPGRLGGKIAIVTGGGLGLGEGIARKFVEEGTKVLIMDVHEQNGQKVRTAIFQKGDVTKEADWEQVVRRDRYRGYNIGRQSRDLYQGAPI